MDTKEQFTALVDERYSFTVGKVGGMWKTFMAMILAFVALALTPVFVQALGYTIPIGERVWWTVVTVLCLAMPIVLTVIYIKAFNEAWASFPKEKCDALEKLEQELKSKENE